MYHDYVRLTPASQWILKEFVELEKKLNFNNSNYDLAHSIDNIDDFVWNKLSKWYVEYLKVDDRDLEFSTDLFSQFVKLCSPYIPFETEALWSDFFDQKQVLALEVYDSRWSSEVLAKSSTETEISKFVDAIEFSEYVRSLRGLYSIDFAKSVIIMTESDVLLNFKAFFEKVAKVTLVEDVDGSVYSFLSGSSKCYLNILSYIDDIGGETSRTNKKIGDIKAQIEAINKSLNNPEFVSNAPSEAVDEKKEQLNLRTLELKQQQTKLTFLEKNV